MNLMRKFSFAIPGKGSTEIEEEEEEKPNTVLEDVKEKSSEIDPTNNELGRRPEEAEEEVDSYQHNEDIQRHRNKISELNIKVANLKAEQDEVSKENASLMETVEELRSKIESAEALVSLKTELKSSKEKQNSLEKVIDELQMEMKCKEEKLNEANLMCKLYQDQTPIDANNEAEKTPQEARMKKSDDDAILVALLKEELEASKDRIRNLQEMFDSMKSYKEEDSKKLLEVTQKLNKIKHLDAEKLIELQQAYDRVNEERDSLSLEIETNRKMVDDQRHQLSRGVIILQEQRDVVLKKELAKQNSIKTFKIEINSKEEILDAMRNCAKDLRGNLEKSEAEAKRMIEDFGDDEHQVIVLQKKILDLEEKLQISEVIDEKKEIEEQKRVNLVNLQYKKLRELEYQSEQLEEKISEHVSELHLINTKHAEQDSKGRKKFSELILVLEALKQKYNLNPEHVQVVSDLENDLANTTYAKEAELEKKTREIVGEWRTKSFQCAKEHTKIMFSLENGKHSMSQKCAIGVSLFAIFLGVLLLGKSTIA